MRTWNSEFLAFPYFPRLTKQVRREQKLMIRLVRTQNDRSCCSNDTTQKGNTITWAMTLVSETSIIQFMNKVIKTEATHKRGLLPWQLASLWDTLFSSTPYKAHHYEHTRESRKHDPHRGTSHRDGECWGGEDCSESPFPSSVDGEFCTSQFVPWK